MILDDASLYAKLISLRDSPFKPNIWNWGADVIVDNKTYKVFNVINIERMSDYIKNHSDALFVELQLSQRLYHEVILPNKDKLRIKLTKYSQDAVGNTVRTSVSYSQTFNAFLTDASSAKAASNSGKVGSDITDDLSGFVETTIQLVDLNLYEYRLLEIVGVYKDVTMTELCQGLMTVPLKSNNGKPIDVDMVPADNAQRYYQTIIPSHGKYSRLIHLPEYLQNKYGIYSSGLGNYLYNGRWYIFPMLNHQRFNKTTHNLTIINVPPNEMSGNDKSYVQNGDGLVIFSSGNSTHIDNSEHVLNNEGRAFRYSINSNLIDNFRDASGESSAIPEDRNYKVVAGEGSPTGLNNVKSIGLTDNPYKAMSAISAGMASLMMIRWEYANTELLYPGMPTKIIYKEGGVVQTLSGTLVGVQSTTTNQVSNPTDKRYITAAALTIICERIQAKK